MQQAASCAKAAYLKLAAADGNWKQVQPIWRDLFCSSCLLQATAASIPLLSAQRRIACKATLEIDDDANIGNDEITQVEAQVDQGEETEEEDFCDNDESCPSQSLTGDSQGDIGEDLLVDLEFADVESQLRGALRLVDLSIIADLR